MVRASAFMARFLNIKAVYISNIDAPSVRRGSQGRPEQNVGI
jgi:hypothetical protein